jgi:hypothetical protein
VREWQGSALAFSAFEFSLRLGSLLVGDRYGSPLLAVALLSASGVIISLASIVRFLRAGHSSIVRLAGPAGRLTALTAVLLAPAALAHYAGHGHLAIATAAAAIAAYYLVLLRWHAASRLLHLRMDASTADPAT